MSIEINFESLGIQPDQSLKLNAHLTKAQAYVVEKDPGIGGAMEWLDSNLHHYLPSMEASLLFEVAEANKSEEGVTYAEEGYDSCQSRRKVAKVVAEALLLGGLTYEFGQLGIATDVSGIQDMLGSDLNISPDAKVALPDIANTYGASQDFLFPGVTPTDDSVESLGKYAWHALAGKPKTSVRSLTGIGGLRHDRDWNFVSDFATFIRLKIKEDKRYYPGIGIYYALLTFNLSDIPVLDGLKTFDRPTYDAFRTFANELKAVPENTYEGVSVLCSSYIPGWSEMRKYHGFASLADLNMSEAFHSPAYDFAQLKQIFDSSRGLNLDNLEKEQLNLLRGRFSNMWSFNSPIHLPWTSELAGISNDMMGLITNYKGDYAVRYGVSHKGKSLEVREYNYGNKRRFPQGISEMKAYALLIYPESDLFLGDRETVPLLPGSGEWQNFAKSGFMAAALKYLE